MAKINKEIYCYIYKITNNINGKCYVGQTVRTIKIRLNKHITESRIKNTTMAICHAIAKYGIENFIIEEIDVAYNQKELDLIEGVYISWFKSLTTQNGYNITKIINGKGKLSEETKIKMRQNANTKERLKKQSQLGKNSRGKSIKNSSSKYCGVSFVCNKWYARHFLNSRLIQLGVFLLEEDAAKAYDIAEIKLNPDAVINFPELRERYLKDEIVVHRYKRKKSDSNVVGVCFHNRDNKWHFRLKGFKGKSFKTKEEAEIYALEYLKIRVLNG